jgi:hypothetical protein
MEMQINGMGGITPSNRYVQVKPKQAIKSVPPPKYGWGAWLIPTKTETTRTDEEIKNDIIELAKNDARRGIYGADTELHGSKTKEYNKLVGEYVTSVSPDRKTIYPAAMARLEKAISLKANKPIIDTSLLDLIVSGIKTSLKRTAAQYDARTRIIEIDNVQIFSGGVSIGSYVKNSGWTWTPTDEELARHREISQLYTKVWKDEDQQIKAGR